MRGAILPAAVVVVLAGCTQLVTTSLPDEQVDDRYAVRTWTWQNDVQLTFAYRAFEDHGRVAVCGARAESPGGDHHQRTFNERALQTLYLTLGGETLLNDIAFFRKGGYVRDAAPEGMASCVRTDMPWSDFYEGVPPELEAAKTRFIVYD